jgi:hypothetical protein
LSRERASIALSNAFTRLQPQGGDSWNYNVAMAQLRQRYGPPHTGNSQHVAADLKAAAGRRVPSGAEVALGYIVEAFRFLAERIATLEDQLDSRDNPTEGWAWLRPPVDVGSWSGPITRHLVSAGVDGVVLHGDCGTGALVGALGELGLTARGVEPRGRLALQGLEQGHAIEIGELSEVMRQQASLPLGGVILSGVVDRLAVHQVLALLALLRSMLRPGAPLIVLAAIPSETDQVGDRLERSRRAGRGLHEQTWRIVLAQSGLVDIDTLTVGDGPDGADGADEADGADGRICLVARSA